MHISKSTIILVALLLLAGGAYFALTAYFGDTKDARTKAYQDKYTECATKTSEVYIAVNPPFFGKKSISNYTTPESSSYNAALDAALTPHKRVALDCHSDLK